MTAYSERGSARLRATLVSRSCTTGWLDWLHGELWMTELGLFRVRRGLMTTLGHAFGPTVATGDDLLTSVVLVDDDYAVLSEQDDSLGYLDRFEMVEHASFRRGIITSRLRIRFHDGTSRKFLWMRWDAGTSALLELLAARLGTRFTY